MSTAERGSNGTDRARCPAGPRLWRTDLQQEDLSAPGLEVIHLHGEALGGKRGTP